MLIHAWCTHDNTNSFLFSPWLTLPVHPEDLLQTGARSRVGLVDVLELEEDGYVLIVVQDLYFLPIHLLDLNYI